jgi:hypothetical protein
VLSIGFLGLGTMGTAMARNLLKAGYDVTVWNRTTSKCDALVSEGAKRGVTPKQTTAACDITFAMLADPAGAVWSYTFLTLTVFSYDAQMCSLKPNCSSGWDLWLPCKWLWVEFTTRPCWMLPSIANLALVGCKPESKDHMGA